MSLNKDRIRKARLFTLAPETLQRLRHFPNASKIIDISIEDYWRKNKRRRF
jgi:hypothetical protein